MWIKLWNLKSHLNEKISFSRQTVYLIFLVGGILFFSQVSLLGWFVSHQRHSMGPGNHRENDVQFLLRFVDLYFNYDYENFVDRQTMAMVFFSDDLRSIKAQEIDFKINRIYDFQVTQKFMTERITRDFNTDRYLVWGKFSVSQKDGWQEFPWKIKISLESVGVDQSNPFGWRVDRLEGESFKPDQEGNDLALVAGNLLEVRLPCVVDHARVLTDFAAQIYYFSQNPHIIQLVVSPSQQRSSAALHFFCPGKKLSIPAQIQEHRHTLYWEIPLEDPRWVTVGDSLAGLPGRPSMNRGAAPKTKNGKAEVQRFRQLLKEHFGIEHLDEKIKER